MVLFIWWDISWLSFKSLEGNSDRIQRKENSLRIVTEAEYLESTEPAPCQIFIGDNPNDRLFHPSVSARKLLYYCYFYQISPPLTEAVRSVASNLGDSGLYWSLLWVSENAPIRHWFVPFSELESLYVEGNHEDSDLVNCFGVRENVMYSPPGKWGIMFSHESFALLCGVNEFVDALCKAVPDLDRQVYDFFLEHKRQVKRHPQLVRST